ncbi:DUF5819 family protein [Leucobacter musarum]|uniref:DUF5819 family protein n=1 Tax=Leucobacter musarum TaxID=1930747 RepID=UPI0006A7983A|nr:DUF5819 family protein [Leucobacter musarum]
MATDIAELPKRGKSFARASIVAIAGIALWHIIASFLWIAPPTPLRDLVPGNALNSYMMPWYGQSWSVFAPAPINGDYDLKVRAVVKDESGSEIATDWVSATDAELTMSDHHFFPPRGSHLALSQASKYKSAWDGLNDEQRRIAQLNFYEGDSWLGRMQIAMNEVGEEVAPVTEFIVAERYTDAYAFQVARAVWGDDVERVQFQVSRQNIIPFTERNDPKAVRPAPTVLSSGWRGIIELPGQSDKDFADTFLPAYHNLISKAADK